MEDRSPPQGDQRDPEEPRPRWLITALLITAGVVSIALGILLVLSRDPFKTLQQMGRGLVGIAAAMWRIVFPDWGTLLWRLLGLALIVFGVLRLGLSLVQLLKLAIALGVLLIAFLLLWDAHQGRPVAAAFSRVGGPTRVETAMEAARFWTTPPQHVVTTSAGKKPLEIMWGAAKCAMLLDAPLLFMPSDEHRERQVERRIAELGADAGPEASLTLEEFVVPVDNQSQVDKCLGSREPSPDPAYADRLSTLGLSNQQLDLRVAAGRELAPFVVFAVAKTPQDPPDVAVALALVAHRARTHGSVSLIVVPQRLETDPGLEKALRERRELITGGVVLGETGILPEDTRALLRQVLNSTGRSGFLGELRTAVQDFEALIAVLLALFGAGVTAQVAPEIVRQYDLVGRRPIMARILKLFSSPDEEPEATPAGRPEKPPAVPSTQRDAWPKVPVSRQVTVWLRSGWRVTGIKEGVDPPTVVKLNEAVFVRQGAEPEKAAMVFVPVDDIELIAVGHEKAVEAPASDKD